MHETLLLAALALVGPAAEERPAEAAKLLPTYRDAAIVAAADLASLEPLDQIYQRYVAIPPDEWWAISLSVNGTLSTVGYMVIPVPVVGAEVGPMPPGAAEKSAYVWRIDLRRLARDAKKDLPEILADWEELADDPYLTEIIDTYSTATEIPVPRYVWRGKAYSTEMALKLRVPARHAGGKLFFSPEGKPLVGPWKKFIEGINSRLEPPAGAGPLDLVWFYTASRAGLVDGRRLVGRTQSQSDLGFGKPLYYEWNQFEKAADRAKRSGAKTEDKRSDLDVILGGRGARVDDYLRAVVMERSKITDHKRSVIVGNLTDVHPGNGQRHWFMTLDPENDRVQFDADPFRVVPIPGRFPRHDAREIIFEGPNGLFRSILTNEAGALQDVAPPGVATDRQVPGVASTELHAGWACCVRCHIMEKGRGLREITNDLRRTAQKYRVGTDPLGRAVLKSLRILDDKSAKDVDELQNQITETHDWEPEAPGGVMAMSRISYEQAVIRATGAKTVDDGLGIYVSVYNDYCYGRIDPVTAAASCGLVLTPEAAVAWAGQLEDQFFALTGKVDPTIAGLARSRYDAETKTWDYTASRWQWEPLYAEVAYVVQLGGRKPVEAP